MNDKKLSRSDSFFGMHFDFHASPDCVVNIEGTAELLDKMLTRIKPDFVQCDSKGHPGITSFESDYGPSAAFPDGISPLQIWRDVTNKHNTALYAHYSGVIDANYINLHPEASVTNADGTTHPTATNMFCNYVDDRMIPQMKELAGKYGVDGIWIDGDCWGVLPDYSPKCLEEFTKATGITEIPRSSEDKYYPEFLEFLRDKYKAFLKHYVEEVHKEYPDFEICSNWMYTMYAPEKAEIGLDFLSGDYAPIRSVREARSHARCIAPQNKPWDLMAWGFSGDIASAGFNVKPPAMLKQEAAVTIALGGGVQFYCIQRFDSTLVDGFIDNFAEGGAFIRERQKYCQGSKSTSDTTIFLSKNSMYRAQQQPYTPRRVDIQNLDGALACILENGRATDISAEHQLEENISRYKFVIVPEWAEMTEESIDFFTAFAEKGGNLLVVGADAVTAFSKVTGIKYSDAVEGNLYFGKGELGAPGSTCTKYRKIEALGENSKALHKTSDSYAKPGYFETTAETTVGKGKIITLSANVFSRYNQLKSSYIRKYIGSLCDVAYPAPKARIKGTSFADLSIQAKDGKEYLHLVNISGLACLSETVIYDEIPVLTDFTVEVICDKKPEKVIMQPDGRELEFYFSDKTLEIKIDKLEIHGILEII